MTPQLNCHSRENGNPEGWGDVNIYDLRENVVWKANLSDSKERIQRDAKRGITRRVSSGTLAKSGNTRILLVSLFCSRYVVLHRRVAEFVLIFGANFLQCRAPL